MDRGLRMRRELAREDEPEQRTRRHRQILAFLENEIGLAGDAPQGLCRGDAALRVGDRSRRARGAGVPESRRRQRRRRATSAGAGDLGTPDRVAAGPRLPGARSARARVHRPRAAPTRSRTCAAADRTEHPQDWRARLALSRHLSRAGQPGDALRWLSPRCPEPARAALHQAIWRRRCSTSTSTGARWIATATHAHAVFYLDPHVCMRCRYRSTELLWQCPHCHDWNYVRRGTHRAGAGRPRTAMPEGVLRVGAHRRHRHRQVLRHAAARRGRGSPPSMPIALARAAVAPGSPGLRAVVNRFGRDILTEGGALDRAKLGSLVFRDATARPTSRH